MNDNDRYKLTWPITSNLTLTSATVVAAIDGTEYPCTWSATPTQSGTEWTGEAITTAYFAGPAHPAPAGATVLTRGLHRVEIRITVAGVTVTATPPDIWVA